MPKKYSEIVDINREYVKASDLVSWRARIMILGAKKRERTGQFPGEEVLFKIAYKLPEQDQREAGKIAYFNLSATAPREDIANYFSGGGKDRIGPLELVMMDFNGREVYQFRDYDATRPATEARQPRLAESGISDEEIPF